MLGPCSILCGSRHSPKSIRKIFNLSGLRGKGTSRVAIGGPEAPAVGSALVGQEGTEEARVGPPHFVRHI